MNKSLPSLYLIKKLQRRGGTERSSLQRDETGRVGSTNTGLTVFYRLVSDGKFAEVVTNHLRLNFNSVELLSVVHTNNASDHFGNNNHVSEVSLNCGRLLINLGCFFLRLFKKNYFSGCPVFVEENITAARSFLRRAIGFLFKPRWENLLRARAWTKSINCSLLRSRRFSRSMPRYWNFLKVRFSLPLPCRM